MHEGGEDEENSVTRRVSLGGITVQMDTTEEDMLKGKTKDKWRKDSPTMKEPG